MTQQKKDKAPPAAGSVDEIDEIMNEIEELQQSMASSQTAPAAKTTSRAKAVPVATPVEPVADEPNVMEEFQAGSGEVSMEETLSNLKDDEPSGPNLIDQAMEAEAARENAPEAQEQEQTEAPQEEQVAEHDDLLDEAETEALEDAIADEEQAVLEEIESDMESEATQEEVAMDANKRRGHPNTVSLKLTGEMVLRLSYEFEGQDVTVSFSDGALKVELSDGTEFKIPVRRNSLRKVA